VAYASGNVDSFLFTRRFVYKDLFVHLIVEVEVIYC
jgi:hypothetical protein